MTSIEITQKMKAAHDAGTLELSNAEAKVIDRLAEEGRDPETDEEWELWEDAGNRFTED